MWRNVDPPPDPTNTMPTLYPYIIPDQQVAWDFSHWTPQVVVINLGTNDGSAPGSVDVSPFVSTYDTFLATVRSNDPNAKIFCTLGPMLAEFNLTQGRSAIQEVVDDVKAQGDANVFFLEYAQDTGANGFGCAYHPSKSVHQAMAQTLVSAVSAQMTGAWEFFALFSKPPQLSPKRFFIETTQSSGICITTVASRPEALCAFRVPSTVAFCWRSSDEDRMHRLWQRGRGAGRSAATRGT